ncbi:ABC transporter permease [Embleya sp. AB8]|uniref:ABC transporter permease n=1 Tax=Embleya sp. AB8 TaxID=3156304 RepID=UPI003C71F787
MRRAAHAEWTKLRTLRSTGWLLLGLIVATVVVGALTAAGAPDCRPSARCVEDTTRDSLTGVRLGQIAVVLLAVSMLGGEYGTGLIRTTLTVFPRRLALLAVKATVLAGVVAAVGTIAVVGSLGVGRLILADKGYPGPSPTDGATLRAAAGTVLYLVLIAWSALGVGAALRDSVGVMTVLLALLYIAPVLVRAIADPDWQRRLARVTPMTAGLAIQATRELGGLPIGPWPGMAVLAGYAATALLVGGGRFVRGDA